MDAVFHSLLVAGFLSLSLLGYRQAYAENDTDQMRRLAEMPSPEDVDIQYIPLAYRHYAANYGVIYGFVIDAGSGLVMAGAQVCYSGQCTISGFDGSYELIGLP